MNFEQLSTQGQGNHSGSSYGLRLVSKMMLVTKANINVDEATHLSFLNKKCFHKKDGD